MTDRPKWLDEMDRAVAVFIIQRGKLVGERFTRPGAGYGSYNDWHDYRDQEFADRHVFECGIKSCSWAETDWYDWQGTFADQPWIAAYGTDATVTCTCGLIEDRHWRCESSLGDLIRAITS